MNKLIDTHAYIGSNKCVGIEIGPEVFLREYEKNFSKYNYDTSFLIMPYSTEGNFEIPNYISMYPTLFLGGYLQLNPNKNFEKILNYSNPKEIESIIESGKIIGLKLNTSATKTKVNDSSLDDFTSIAEKNNLPILFHCSATGQDYTHINFFKDLRKKRPTLKIICAHYGGLNINYINEFVKLAYDDENLYLNTTGLSGQIKRWDFDTIPPKIYHESNHYKWKKVFLATIQKIESKVLFGTDFPELEFTLNPINYASQSVQESILYKNAIKIFKIKN
jgi:predicted TIM-barrel fold metal-dependent hydrolase